jgi:peptidoglycan/xylan/chitin deacetylase (PgdA/CDA1 family)
VDQLSAKELQSRRERARQQRTRARRRRIAAAGAIVAVVAIGAGIALASGGGGSHPSPLSASNGAVKVTTGGPARAASAARRRHRAAQPQATGVPGTAAVPILMYHVINPPPAGAPFPGLYVPAAEFAAQMRTLKAAGWHAVTLDQLAAYWSRGVPLGPGKPIVLSFDNGYESQYTNALPVLKQLGWVGDENIQLTGLPPSQGGLSEDQVRALIAAGWELDTQGISHADLITLDSSELHDQVATARQILRTRYRVPVNWFCYPSGHYNATVVDAVKAAGFVGSTTVIPGWASPRNDPFRLPRLRVLGGTSPSQLLGQIASAQTDAPAPTAYPTT